MAAKENNRFVKIYAQGALVQTEIWVDTVTGVLVYSKGCCKNPAGRRYRSKGEAD